MYRRAYSIKEFGDAYGPKRSLTYRLIKEGKLKAVTAGRKRLILADDAEAWLISLKATAIKLTV